MSTISEVDVRTRIDRLLESDLSDRPGFLGAQYDLGLAWIHFPEGSGGLGADRGFQKLVHDAVVAVDAPQPKYEIGYGMAAPTIVTVGTDDQKARWLRPLFTGEEVWFQIGRAPV